MCGKMLCSSLTFDSWLTGFASDTYVVFGEGNAIFSLLFLGGVTGTELGNVESFFVGFCRLYFGRLSVVRRSDRREEKNMRRRQG